MDRFGEKLRILRERHGISLRNLSTELGFSGHTHLSRIEWGEKSPSARLAVKIADYFDVSLDRLMRDELELDG
ncbi:helix-turn-helix transcriptional regulator [Anaerolineales bacterium HSG25]|nr:helix-turn-helix transcriptional regulator [Anaerolineales bacterium HSG25]